MKPYTAAVDPIFAKDQSVRSKDVIVNVAGKVFIIIVTVDVERMILNNSYIADDILSLSVSTNILLKSYIGLLYLYILSIVATYEVST